MTARHVEEAAERIKPKQKGTKEEAEIINVDWVVVRHGGEIASTNTCAGRILSEQPEVKLDTTFWHMGREFVCVASNTAGLPGSRTVEQFCHQLLAFPRSKPAPKRARGDDPEGRIVLFGGERAQLGPRVVFRGTESKEQEREFKLEVQAAPAANRGNQIALTLARVRNAHAVLDEADRVFSAIDGLKGPKDGEAGRFRSQVFYHFEQVRDHLACLEALLGRPKAAAARAWSEALQRRDTRENAQKATKGTKERKHSPATRARLSLLARARWKKLKQTAEARRTQR